MEKQGLEACFCIPLWHWLPKNTFLLYCFLAMKEGTINFLSFWFCGSLSESVTTHIIANCMSYFLRSTILNAIESIG